MACDGLIQTAADCKEIMLLRVKAPAAPIFWLQGLMEIRCAGMPRVFPRRYSAPRLCFRLSGAKAFDRGTMPPRKLVTCVGTSAVTLGVQEVSRLVWRVDESGLPMASETPPVWISQQRLLLTHSATLCPATFAPPLTSLLGFAGALSFASPSAILLQPDRPLAFG